MGPCLRPSQTNRRDLRTPRPRRSSSSFVARRGAPPLPAGAAQYPDRLSPATSGFVGLWPSCPRIRQVALTRCVGTCVRRTPVGIGGKVRLVVLGDRRPRLRRSSSRPTRPPRSPRLGHLSPANDLAEQLSGLRPATTPPHGTQPIVVAAPVGSGPPVREAVRSIFLRRLSRC